jgi:hypothetical protein
LAGSIEGDNESVDACPFPLGKLTALGAELSPVKTMVVLSALMAELFATFKLPFSTTITMSVLGALPARKPLPDSVRFPQILYWV